MIRKTSTLLVLGIFIALAACKAGPPSSGSSGKDQAAILQSKIRAIELLLASRDQAADALDALLSNLPDRVWLSEAAYDAGKITVRGRAATNQLLADYIALLGGSPALINVSLGGSTMRIVRGRESQDFSLQALAPEVSPEPAPAGAAHSARLEELEKMLPVRQDAADMLREIQRLVLDSGLQMTKFTPGAEAAGEFTSALPVTVEVAGDLDELDRLLYGLAGLSRLWVVDRFSLRAASPDDPRSTIRASIAARTFFVR